MNSTTSAPSPDAAARAAVAQLAASGRGLAAARAFRALLEGGGAGLDRANWKAIETLCRLAAADGHFPYRLVEMLPEPLPPARRA